MSGEVSSQDAPCGTCGHTLLYHTYLNHGVDQCGFKGCDCKIFIEELAGEVSEQVPDAVPDLYELAFMPGQFRCPTCGFQLSKQTISVAHGMIGTTETNRQSEPCPNDGAMMAHVTYREQLGAYADRLKEEFDRRDAAEAQLAAVTAERDALHKIISDMYPRTFPMHCDCCGAIMQSKEDYEWHGIGNCVLLCDTCCGAGFVDKESPNG